MLLWVDVGEDDGAFAGGVVLDEGDMLLQESFGDGDVRLCLDGQSYLQDMHVLCTCYRRCDDDGASCAEGLRQSLLEQLCCCVQAFDIMMLEC